MLAHSMDYLRLPIMLTDCKSLPSQYFLLVDKSKKRKRLIHWGIKLLQKEISAFADKLSWGFSITRVEIFILFQKIRWPWKVLGSLCAFFFSFAKYTPNALTFKSNTSQYVCKWGKFCKYWIKFLVVVQSLVSDSLWPHGQQHARLPCPSPSPGVCSNSCPLSQWCHPTVSCSVALFSCPQSFPASGSFPMSWLFASGGQSTGASASASALPVNIQDWFPLGLTDLLSKGLSRVFSSITVRRHKLFGAQPSSSHIYTWLLEKPQLWLYRPLSAKWYLCFLIHCLGLS